MKRTVNISYLGGRSRGEPEMDAWLPENGRKEPADAVLLLHGGGWTTGDKADEREQNMARALCMMGYAVFSVNYHMAQYEYGPYCGKRIDAAWPECMKNCMDAVSYIRANASSFGICADHICAMGSSAGGHLALLLATAQEAGLFGENRHYPKVSCRIAGAVSFYGVPDILEWGGELLMPGPYEQLLEEWHMASPAAQLERRYPPVLLVHGDADETVPVTQSIRFYEQLKSHGHRAELMIVKGGRHSFDLSALSEQQLCVLSSFLHSCFGKENGI